MLKLILRPDENLVNKINQEEFAVLNNKKKNLTKVAVEEMKKDYVSLLEHQNQLQNLDVLPSIKLEDIPNKVEEIVTSKHNLVHGKK